MQCPGLLQLINFRHRQLRPEQAETMRAHINSCEYCQAEMKRLERIRATLRALPASATRLGCFTPDQYLMLLAGKIHGNIKDTMEMHMALCEQCMREVLILAEEVPVPCDAECETARPSARAIEQAKSLFRTIASKKKLAATKRMARTVNLFRWAAVPLAAAAAVLFAVTVFPKLFVREHHDVSAPAEDLMVAKQPAEISEDTLGEDFPQIAAIYEEAKFPEDKLSEDDEISVSKLCKLHLVKENLSEPCEKIKIEEIDALVCAYELAVRHVNEFSDRAPEGEVTTRVRKKTFEVDHSLRRVIPEIPEKAESMAHEGEETAIVVESQAAEPIGRKDADTPGDTPDTLPQRVGEDDNADRTLFAKPAFLENLKLLGQGKTEDGTAHLLYELDGKRFSLFGPVQDIETLIGTFRPVSGARKAMPPAKEATSEEYTACPLGARLFDESHATGTFQVDEPSEGRREEEMHDRGRLEGDKEQPEKRGTAAEPPGDRADAEGKSFHEEEIKEHALESMTSPIEDQKREVHPKHPRPLEVRLADGRVVRIIRLSERDISLAIVSETLSTEEMIRIGQEMIKIFRRPTQNAEEPIHEQKAR